MQVVIQKSSRLLCLWDKGALVLRCRVALGTQPVGAKRAQGDGRTPEGVYHICLTKEQGKYGRSLGLDYPSAGDAELGYGEGRIDLSTRDAILAAHAEGRRPPWGTPLGGEIYLHEGGTARDWTAGCVALESGDMDVLFSHWQRITQVILQP